MSNENVLFLRGSGNKSEDEDVWDDTALIQAYDKAVTLAKEEVAKRIAMDVCNQQTTQKSQSYKHMNHTKKIPTKWSIGAPCRAVYSVDGEIYEAIIIKIHEESGICTVKFVGYQNVEKVKLSSLMESGGLQSQIAQQKDALAQKSNEESINSDTSAYSSQNSKQINGYYHGLKQAKINQQKRRNCQ
ncbi:Survival motor neuron protein [Camponotus floridanus]|uniref:Survival motor neuron protein n=1 Tax=Camponotus floridanus TaxID=104421 RepID=E2A7Y8_CAMFO|nr:Survival motor neuron protein [Camponotus floridanus]